MKDLVGHYRKYPNLVRTQIEIISDPNNNNNNNNNNIIISFIR